MAQIVIKDLVKKYAQTTALKNLSVSIASGELTAVIGESESGKTALLRSICGLDSVDGGEIYVDGVLVNKLEPKDRDMAIVFKSVALYADKTVYENMAMGLKLRKVAKADIDVKVKAAAALLDLTDYLQHKAKNLSVGQRQRVLLARAIVREPKVVLFDEPLNGLDLTLKREILTEIVKLNKRLKINFIYATKDSVEAFTIADKIMFMEEGELVQYGAPLELYDKPANLAIASYFGTPSVNLLSGKLVSEDGQVFGAVEGVKIPLKQTFSNEEKATYVDTGRNVTFAFRAEDVALSENGAFKVAVDEVDGEGESPIATLYSSSVEKAKKFLAYLDVEKGDEISIDIDKEHINVYDANSEKLIG